MLFKIIFFAAFVALSQGRQVCSPVKKPQCGENEAYSTCGSVCSEPKCPRYGFEELFCPAVCNEGCFCAEGYVRGTEGKCIPLETCPAVTCPANQHYSECGAACVPTCDNPVLLFCPYICMPGCVCDEGYVKNSEGECIVAEQCPPRQCGDNEEFLEYGNSCESTCRHPGTIFCKAAARSGCFCKEGYVRDDNYLCVLKEECPAETRECYGEHEVYNECGSTCGDLTCDVPSFAAVTCLAGCQPGCFCEEGYVRNNENICVPVEDCNPIVGHCPANEVWSDCGPADGCEASCEPSPFDFICTEQCVPKCVCQEGYIRDSSYNCIPYDSCPVPECGENEIYTDCGSGCGDKTCEKRPDDIFCPAVCLKGCFCAEGFVRDSFGRCVKEEECPTCPENEQFSACGAACFGTCANQFPFICPAICMPGCVCSEGLVRNAEGICVEPSQCPKVEECGVNEHYTDCGSGCGDLTCYMQSYAAVLCPDVCNPGCFCDEGYVRNEQNICVLPSTCPNNGCKDNEVWNECGPVDACEATCKNPDLIDVACPDVCVQKCVCQEGYVRDANYNCVPRDSCSAVQCGDNEVYTTCGSGCGDITCDSKDIKDLVCPAVCRVGCFCAEGFVRDVSGKCIKPDQCEKVECGEHEEYQVCGIGGCQNTCAQPELSTVCDPFGCSPGCYCSKGYIRNSDGSCVLPENCPAVECGKNQHYEECGVNGCENTCAQPELEKVCRNIRCQEGCYCDEGYIRAPDGECVLPENCPAQCGENEEYFPECGPGACENTCEQPEKQLVCKAQCEPGCFCSEGFVRDSSGNCVRQADCSAAGCGPNERFDECGANGCQNTCENPTLSMVCRGICTPGCICQDEFIRDSQGNCILPSECPQDN